MNSHTAYKNNHTQTVGYWPAILDVKKRPSQKRLGRNTILPKTTAGKCPLTCHKSINCLQFIFWIEQKASPTMHL